MVQDQVAVRDIDIDLLTVTGSTGARAVVAVELIQGTVQKSGPITANDRRHASLLKPEILFFAIEDATRGNPADPWARRFLRPARLSTELPRSLGRPTGPPGLW